MSIFPLLADQAFNNYSTIRSQFQDWGPQIVAEVYYNPNAGVLIPPTINLPIKDFLNVPEYSQYTAFRLRLNQFTTSFVLVALPTGMSANPFTLVSNGTVFTQTIVFQNLALLPDGTHFHDLNFIVQGLQSNGQWSNDLSNHVYSIKLIKSSTSVIWSPLNFAVAHQQGLPFAWHEIDVNGSSWTISSTSKIILDSDDVDVTITYLGTNLGYIATGSGAKIVKFKLAPYYDTGAPDPLSLYEVINVFFGSSQLVGVIPVSISVLINGFIYSETTAMNFEGYKGIQEPLAQFVGISAVLSPILIDASPWLTSVPATSQTGVFPFQNGFYIKPIASTNLAPGLYTGFVRFYVVNTDATYFPTGQYSRTVSVTYRLYGDVVSPYDNNKVALTLAPFLYQFFAQTLNTYFEMIIKLKVNDFDNIETTKTINLKVALFQQKAKENLGRLIHRLMALPNFQTDIQYRPAELVIDVTERDFITHNALRTFTTTPQKFIAGFNESRAGNIFLESQFLNINRQPKRIYKGQRYYFAFYQNGMSDMFIDLFRNGTFVNNPFFISDFSEMIRGVSLLINNVQQGDRLDYYIYHNPNADDFNDLYFEPEQIESLVCFPPPKHWNDIVWVDEFKMLKNFVFGGDFSIESEKDFIQNRVYNGIFEALKNVDLNNIKKIKINTGWMLKSDAETIESLLNSPKVYLIESYWNNGSINQYLEITPLNTKIVHENSTDMTIAITLEFEITPTR